MSAALGSSALSSCSIGRDVNSPFLENGGVGVIAVKDGVRVLERADGFASGLDAAEVAPRHPFTLDTPFRVASISKTAALLTAHRMGEEGALNLDADISGPMGMSLRHPDYPEIPITLRLLLSHRSGISDPDVYWTLPDGNIRELLSPQMFKGGKPGEWFEYANINYGIAATVMEAVSARRFDELTRDYVLGPLGLDCGFNWAGVSAKKRAQGATLYRLVDDKMKIQTDGPASLTQSGPVVYGDDQKFDLSAYKPGRNGTLLSPQGGLRASLNDLVTLAKHIGERPDLSEIVWTFNGKNGRDDGGHFLNFGPGLYVYPPEHSPIPGQLMVGHHGEAYGMYGGMWHLPMINAQIVHAVTATPEPPRPPYAGPPAIAAESRVLLNEAMMALSI